MAAAPYCWERNTLDLYALGTSFRPSLMTMVRYVICHGIEKSEDSARPAMICEYAENHRA
jgi:hypothetical protein